jgi:hypothetical protein
MARAATTADAFNAVAEPRRREILDVLAGGERPVNDLVRLLGLAQPQVSKPPVEDRGDCRAAAQRDDRVSGQVRDGDAWSRWGAVGGEGGDHLLAAQALDGELAGRLAGQQAEGGVELVGGEKAQHVAGDALAEADLDARVGAAEACEQPGDVEAAGGQERSDPDAPAQDAPKLVDLLACGVDFREHAAGSSGHRASRLGGRDAAAGALEQWSPELLLEPSDLVRQRRLRDVELFGGAREMAVPCHRLDASQLSELHPDDRRSRSLS